MPTSIAAAAEDGAVFFVDTSLFDDRTDPAITEALLSTPASTVLIPEIKAELAPWISRRPQAAISKAMAAGHPALREYASPEGDAWRSGSRRYYANILAMRKRLFELMKRHFITSHGRPPNANEGAALRVEAQQNVGERGYLLAKKGHAERGRPNRFTDNDHRILGEMARWAGPRSPNFR